MPGDNGTQIVTLRFFDPVETPVVNKRQKDIIPTGIYKGGYLTKKGASDSEVYLSPLVCEIQDDSGNHDQVRVETTSVVTVTGVAAGTPYIVLRWTYTGVAIDDYMDFGSGCTAVSSPDTYDLVVGKASYSGATLTGFTYAERSNPSVKDLFLKVEPEQIPSKYLRVRAGVVQVGNNKVVIPDQQTSVFTSSVTATGAVYIDDAGIVQVSSNFTYAGQMVLAEIAITSGMTTITQNLITDVRSFLTNPIIPDGTTIERSSTGKLQVVNSFPSIVFNTNNAQSSLNLVLSTGTWTVMAHFWGRGGDLPTMNLRIDGTIVATSSDMPEQTGTDTAAIMGAKESVAGSRTIVIDYTTSGGGGLDATLRGLFAFAIRTG